MKLLTLARLTTVLALLAASNASAVIFTNLYTFSQGGPANSFAAGTNGGYYPQAALLLSGASTLYGTTAYGSTNNDGTVFKFVPGSFVNLHNFTGIDGAVPVADLAISGSTLFGTTSKGGAYGGGTIFAMNTNGTGFTTLYNFAFTNGASPQAGLTLSGNVLYGTTAYGGAYGAGTLFVINTNGTGFTNLYNFNYTNGANPEADLLLLGNTLYGTTANGGSNGLGTVFAVSTNGIGFTNLLSFNGTNGSNPQAGLSLVSPYLCGTTVNGGTNNAGTVFVIGTDGTSFNIVHNFGSTFSDGKNPYARLAVSSNGPSSYSLYGTAEMGGSTFGGIWFQLDVGGPGLTIVNYAPSTGLPGIIFPMAGLAFSPSIGSLYGTATSGLTSPYSGGGLFTITFGFSSGTLSHTFAYSQSTFAVTNGDGANSRAGLVSSGNALYGTAYRGGANGYGTIFTINEDGSGFADVRNLTSSNASPWASLTLSGNTLYGTATGVGGSQSAAFSLNTDGTGLTNLANLNGIYLTSYPEGNLLLVGNTLYGTTTSGGSTAAGSLFAVNTDGTGYTNFIDFGSFSGQFGFSPACGLVLGGNTLYGTTQYGLTNKGVIFAINTDGTGMTDIFGFNGFNGARPVGTLVLSGDMLYGVTTFDANRNCGTIFAVKTDGSGFTNLYNFSGPDGANPFEGLILSGNTLYGTTSAGGSGGYGTVFSINTDGSGFTTLYNFSGGNDGATPYDGLLLSGNTLYGTTFSGGGGGNGTVFALSLGPIPLNIQSAGSNVVLSWGNPSFTLESAPDVTGPYTPISGATSPYTNTITASQQFFRLQQP